jgi:hypothetical protein
MADESSRATQRRAVQRIKDAQGYSLTLPALGSVRIPRPEQLAYFGALAALAALEVIEWPIALAIGAGHALAQSSHNRVAQEIGEALEEA